MPLQSFLSFFKKLPMAFSYSEAVFSADGKPQDFVFKSVNAVFEKLFGVRKKDLIGKSLLRTLPNAEWHDRLKRAVITSSLQSFELRGPEADRWIKMTVIPEDVSHLACIAEDNSKSNVGLIRKTATRLKSILTFFLLQTWKAISLKSISSLKKRLAFLSNSLRPAVFSIWFTKKTALLLKKRFREWRKPKNLGILSAAAEP